jgi:predicted phage terminase large subunit-like protein
LWIPHKPTPKQLIFLNVDKREALFGGSAGGGKLLPLDTPLATPHGWTTMGAVQAGDIVFGVDGLPHGVLAASAVQERSGWRLTFDDGAEIVAHDEHRWLTFDASELAALTRRDPEWRSRRRERRISRASGKKTSRFTAALVARNALHPPVCLPPPAGTIRTTAELVATLYTPAGRVNHAIPVTAPLALPERELPLDPYVLGVWLGDGKSRVGGITSMDAEIVAAVESAGFAIGWQHQAPGNRATDYRFDGLYQRLRYLGVIRNKHIPDAYLWASEAQRIALVQGLLDTDGNVGNNGQVEFTNTNRRIVDGLAHVLRSLGHKIRIREGRATLYGKDCGVKYVLKFAPLQQLFRLPRKAERLKLAERRTTRFRYLVGAERVERQSMRCIRVSAPDGLYLAGESFIATHNTECLLMAALQYVDVPSYKAMLFRETLQDLRLPGGLIPRSHEWLDDTPARWNDNQHQWTFPSGATLSFGYLANEEDHLRYKGMEAQFIGFDELTQHREHQYRYLFSRLRRLATAQQVPIRMRSATNPGGPGEAWVRERFGLDPEHPEQRSAAIDAARIFIPSRLEDNPYLDTAEYEASLNELPLADRLQLRYGDWTIKPRGGTFQRAWFPHISDVPDDMRWVRYWDMAATSEAQSRRRGRHGSDYTAGVLLGEKNGRYVVGHAIHFRHGPKDAEDVIARTAREDGPEVPIAMEQESGASGVIVIDHYARTVLRGYTFIADPKNVRKELRADPVASAAQRGLVSIVTAPWNTEYLDELEAFPSATVHDDLVDATSGAFAMLRQSGESGVPMFTRAGRQVPLASGLGILGMG